MDETGLPENGTPPTYPTQPPGEVPVASPVKVKLRTDPGFFILGLLTPFVLWGLGLLGLTNEWSIMTVVGLTTVLFFVFLAMNLKARDSGNVRLFSYAKGGMWAYVAVPLLALVAFGSCLVYLNP